MTIPKAMMISMCFVLLGGILLSIWQKTEAVPGSAACAGGHVDLKGRGVIVGSVIQGRSVIVTLERDDGSDDIVTIDVCTGKITGDLTLEGDQVSESSSQI